MAGYHQLLICIPPCNHKIYSQIQNTQKSQKPEEVMKITIVQVIRYPARLAIPSAEICHNVNKQCAQIVPQRSSC